MTDQDDLENRPLMPDGFDDCVIGLTTEMTPAVIYDHDKVIESIMNNNEMDHEEAVDFFEYNVVRGAQYEKGIPPIYIRTLTADEIHAEYE